MSRHSIPGYSIRSSSHEFGAKWQHGQSCEESSRRRYLQKFRQQHFQKFREEDFQKFRRQYFQKFRQQDFQKFRQQNFQFGESLVVLQASFHREYGRVGRVVFTVEL